mmetsp:Transcript_30126/g.92952  ORF Transcript_30126/g.92952 Transcript_30126/m.92952 type:complete len:270 (+) Transcript_30126:195-1004(+)
MRPRRRAPASGVRRERRADQCVLRFRHERDDAELRRAAIVLLPIAADPSLLRPRRLLRRYMRPLHRRRRHRADIRERWGDNDVPDRRRAHDRKARIHRRSLDAGRERLLPARAQRRPGERQPGRLGQLHLRAEPGHSDPREPPKHRRRRRGLRRLRHGGSESRPQLGHRRVGCSLPTRLGGSPPRRSCELHPREADERRQPDERRPSERRGHRRARDRARARFLRTLLRRPRALGPRRHHDGAVGRDDDSHEQHPRQVSHVPHVAACRA